MALPGAAAAATASHTTDEYVLWHCVGSRSIRCLWTLHELGAHDRVRLRVLPFPPRVLRRDFLDVNPLGTVPCLELPSAIPGGARRIMTESVAIAVYLASALGGPCGGGLVVGPDEPAYPEYLNWLAHSDVWLRLGPGA